MVNGFRNNKMNENENKLLNISVTLAEISSQIKHMSEAIHKLDSKVNSLDHTIRGNGQEGIVTKIAKIEQIEERKAKRELLVFGSLLSLTIAVISIIIKSVI